MGQGGPQVFGRFGEVPEAQHGGRGEALDGMQGHRGEAGLGRASCHPELAKDLVTPALLEIMASFSAARKVLRKLRMTDAYKQSYLCGT
ncbi:hypothetical protein GCM10028822_16950 [Hymenobacter terrigena]